MVAGPRYRRGVRHRLAVILGLAVCAVLAGTWSFTAIAGWAVDADAETLPGPRIMASLCNRVITIVRLAAAASIAAALLLPRRRPAVHPQTIMTC